MRSIAVVLLGLMLSATAFAGISMELMHKAAHELQTLKEKNLLNSAFLTDTQVVLVNEQALVVHFVSPSADRTNPNVLFMNFTQFNGTDGDGDLRLKGFSPMFVSSSPRGPLLKKADISVILVNGIEAIVNHVKENPVLSLIANSASSIYIKMETTGPSMKVKLNDGNVYSVNMDDEGNVLSQGF